MQRLLKVWFCFSPAKIWADSKYDYKLFYENRGREGKQYIIRWLLKKKVFLLFIPKSERIHSKITGYFLKIGQVAGLLKEKGFASIPSKILKYYYGTLVLQIIFIIKWARQHFSHKISSQLNCYYNFCHGVQGMILIQYHLEWAWQSRFLGSIVLRIQS